MAGGFVLSSRIVLLTLLWYNFRMQMSFHHFFSGKQ